MKKIYIFTVVCFATTIALGQDSNDTLTFESINLEDESYYNGSDGAGEIVFGNLILSNTYSGYWANGFAVSNVTDVTTPGYTNSYASFTGSGSNSENFGVFYSTGMISFNQERIVTSLDVTNTTYAALSMRDGDSFGKQFGSIYAADGVTEDGTNGEDFFLLKIIPLNESNNAAGDTVSFYLADYRFDNDIEDYFLDSWTTIDLTANPLTANKIKFELTSSDNHPTFGMNTPAYFALDNFVSHATVGVNEMNSIAWSAYPNPFNGNLIVQSEQSGTITITNGIGQQVAQEMVDGSTQLDLSNLSSGVYYATIETAEGKNTQKIVKN